MADLWRDFWIRETGTGQRVAQLHDRYMMMIHSFIPSVFCLTTGPKPPPKRCLHMVRSRASSQSNESYHHHNYYDGLRIGLQDQLTYIKWPDTETAYPCPIIFRLKMHVELHHRTVQLGLCKLFRIPLNAENFKQRFCTTVYSLIMGQYVPEHVQVEVL